MLLSYNGCKVDHDSLIRVTSTKILIQASYSIGNNDTREREIRSLLKAMEEQNLDIGYIYTYNSKEEIAINNKTIKVLPFWEEALG